MAFVLGDRLSAHAMVPRATVEYFSNMYDPSSISGTPTGIGNQNVNTPSTRTAREIGMINHFIWAKPDKDRLQRRDNLL